MNAHTMKWNVKATNDSRNTQKWGLDIQIFTDLLHNMYGCLYTIKNFSLQSLRAWAQKQVVAEYKIISKDKNIKCMLTP